MGFRTFGVRTAGQRNDDSVSGSPAVNDIVTPSAMTNNIESLENDVNNILSQDIVDGGVGGSKKPTADAEYYGASMEEASKKEADLKQVKNAKKALVAADMANDLVGSWFKHEAIVNQNNYNILQANRQIFQVQSQAGFAKLREQTKAKMNQESAKLSAVARGQSSSGDVAGVMEGNEEMMLAQNLMNIEVSEARAILGLKQDMIQYGLSNKLSKYQRNMDMANTAIMGGFQLMM